MKDRTTGTDLLKLVVQTACHMRGESSEERVQNAIDLIAEAQVQIASGNIARAVQSKRQDPRVPGEFQPWAGE